MRRAVATGIVMTALASGCGGESDRSADRPTRDLGSQGPAAAATHLAPDGRLGAAVVARPGNLQITARERPITGRSIRPRSRGLGVGAEANCADAELQPSAGNLPQVADVVFCLMNAMRENEGLPSLRQQAELAQASLGHSQDMVDKKYFAHDSQDGRDLVARLTEVGYVPDDAEWVVGENLAWGAGALATPKALVNAWMNSPGHRANLLSGDFQEVGLGLVLGTPNPDASDGVTVTTDFGTRIAAVAVASQRETAPRTRRSSRRRAALRKCNRKKGNSKRRCVRAARRIR